MAQKGYKRRTRRSSRKTRRNRRTRRRGFCLGRKKYHGGVCPCSARSANIQTIKGGMRKGMKGGNYATDITTASFQGFPYKNEKSTVVAFPGTPGVMDLKDYKQMMEDEDREGYDPTA